MTVSWLADAHRVAQKGYSLRVRTNLQQDRPWRGRRVVRTGTQRLPGWQRSYSTGCERSLRRVPQKDRDESLVVEWLEEQSAADRPAKLGSEIVDLPSGERDESLHPRRVRAALMR